MCQTAGVAGSAKESQPCVGLCRVRPGFASRSHPDGRRPPTEVGQFDRPRKATGRKFCPAPAGLFSPSPRRPPRTGATLSDRPGHVLSCRRWEAAESRSATS